jgi:uncharacterized protein
MGAPTRIDHNVRVPMRDGVTLAADIYFPQGKGPFPVLLTRTPYNKASKANVQTAILFAEHGYVAVTMDCRGLFASGGQWHPYINEARDGYDSQKWIGLQPWCNRKVGIYGISYSGYDELAPARYRSPYVKAIMPVGAQSDNFGSVWYRDGIFYLAFALQWATKEEAIHEKKPMPSMDWMKLSASLPVESTLDQIGIHSSFLAQVIANPIYDDFWRQMSLHGQYRDMNLPSFFVTGWFDELLHETFTNFTNMRKLSSSEHARRWQKLLVGPWEHGNTSTTKLAGINFGAESFVDLRSAELRWFDYHLKGTEKGLENETPIRVFIMGANEWRNLRDWPPPQMRPARFNLHSDGFANTRFGGGVLAQDLPDSEPADHYIYDPRNPVPTFGGHGCCAGEMASAGPRDQRAIQERLDVLVYTTKPLTRSVEIIGAPELELSFSAGVRDTDFFATLTDVYPDGRAPLVTDGSLRARFRNSLTNPSPLMPGKIYQVTVPLWETAYLFNANHRIRLQITSSNFPEFDRNLNTVKPFGKGTERDIRIARLTIYHSREHPSLLVLPVIPAVASTSP